jgi:hypothetical protein
MSATALAEYMILNPLKQERILHDSKFAATSIVIANRGAHDPLRDYNTDYARDTSRLDRVKESLTTRSRDPAVTPHARDEAARCIETIDLFLRLENSLGTRGFSLSTPPRQFLPLRIEGVDVSIRPDFLRHGPRNTVGAGMLRLAKSPDPNDCKRPATREQRGAHRLEMARYMIALYELLLDAQKGALGAPDRSLCFVSDVRLGETIGPGTEHGARIAELRAACRQIARAWGAIAPRPGLLAGGS